MSEYHIQNLSFFSSVCVAAYILQDGKDEPVTYCRKIDETRAKLTNCDIDGEKKSNPSPLNTHNEKKQRRALRNIYAQCHRTHREPLSNSEFFCKRYPPFRGEEVIQISMRHTYMETSRVGYQVYKARYIARNRYSALDAQNRI